MKWFAINMLTVFLSLSEIPVLMGQIQVAGLAKDILVQIPDTALEDNKRQYAVKMKVTSRAGFPVLLQLDSVVLIDTGNVILVHRQLQLDAGDSLQYTLRLNNLVFRNAGVQLAWVYTSVWYDSLPSGPLKTPFFLSIKPFEALKIELLVRELHFFEQHIDSVLNLPFISMHNNGNINEMYQLQVSTANVKNKIAITLAAGKSRTLFFRELLNNHSIRLAAEAGRINVAVFNRQTADIRYAGYISVYRLTSRLRESKPESSNRVSATYTHSKFFNAAVIEASGRQQLGTEQWLDYGLLIQHTPGVHGNFLRISRLAYLNPQWGIELGNISDNNTFSGSIGPGIRISRSLRNNQTVFAGYQHSGLTSALRDEHRDLSALEGGYGVNGRKMSYRTSLKYTYGSTQQYASPVFSNELSMSGEIGSATARLQVSNENIAGEKKYVGGIKGDLEYTFRKNRWSYNGNNEWASDRFAGFQRGVTSFRHNIAFQPEQGLLRTVGARINYVANRQVSGYLHNSPAYAHSRLWDAAVNIGVNRDAFALSTEAGYVYRHYQWWDGNFPAIDNKGLAAGANLGYRLHNLQSAVKVQYFWPAIGIHTAPRHQYTASVGWKRMTVTYELSNSQTGQLYDAVLTSIASSRNRQLLSALGGIALSRQVEISAGASYQWVDHLKDDRLLNTKFGSVWNFAPGWSIGYSNNYFTNINKSYNYRNMMHTLHVTKTFGSRLLRQTSLQLVFFDDMNGNGIMEQDEKRVEGVLVAVNQHRLTSDTKGMVEIVNFDHANDKIVLQNIGEYYTDWTAAMIGNLRHRTKVYIPLYKQRRITGMVSINDRTETADQLLPILKIKVVMDNGKTCYTYTDEKGAYTISMPVGNMHISVSIDEASLDRTWKAVNAAYEIDTDDTSSQLSIPQLTVEKKKRTTEVIRFSDP